MKVNEKQTYLYKDRPDSTLLTLNILKVLQDFNIHKVYIVFKNTI